MPNFNNPVFDERASLLDEFGIMQSIADEFEAAYRYMKLASIAGDSKIKAVYQDVAKEELVHAGEFMAILGVEFPEVIKFMEQGKEEVFEMLQGVKGE